MGLLSWWRGRKISLADGAFWSSWFNGDTWSGESVGPEAALNLSAWWACVRLVSETVATLPLFVYRTGRDGSREIDRDHVLYGLLHDSPNADQTAVEFWEGQIAALCTAGNGYAEKVFTGDRLTALQPLMPDCVSVWRNADGALRYAFTDRGKRYELPEDKIFHVRGWGGGDVGLSPVGYARQTLGMTVATEKAAGKAFAHGLRASGFFTSPNGATLTPEQRRQFKETFIDPYVGGDATAKVGLLEAGFDFKPVNMTLADAEMLLSRRWNVEEICRWLNVPPILIGHAGQGQTMWGSGVEQIMLGWLTLGLRPYLTRIEQAVAKRLMTPADRTARLKAEFSVEGLLRADSASRAEFLSKMVQNGIYTRNRARALENEPRDPDPMADRLTVQSNLVALGRLGEASADPSAQARSALLTLLGPELDTLVAARAKALAAPAVASPMETKMKRKEASLKIRDFDLQVKAVQEDGTFSGYGSVFGVVDSYNEIVAAGAFAESLAEIAAKGRLVPVLWQHRSAQPIGVYEKLVEDATGLYVEGRLLKDDVAQAREAHALLRAGALSGLSIGYYVRASTHDEKTGIRTLTRLDLSEVSLVTFPANEEARVDSVKSQRMEEFARKLRDGEPMPVKEFEDILREAGVPRAMARQIASVGYAKAIRCEAEGEANDAAAFLKALLPSG